MNLDQSLFASRTKPEVIQNLLGQAVQEPMAFVCVPNLKGVLPGKLPLLVTARLCHLFEVPCVILEGAERNAAPVKDEQVAGFVQPARVENLVGQGVDEADGQGSRSVDDHVVLFCAVKIPVADE